MLSLTASIFYFFKWHLSILPLLSKLVICSLIRWLFRSSATCSWLHVLHRLLSLGLRKFWWTTAESTITVGEAPKRDVCFKMGQTIISLNPAEDMMVITINEVIHVQCPSPFKKLLMTVDANGQPDVGWRKLRSFLAGLLEAMAGVPDYFLCLVSLAEGKCSYLLECRCQKCGGWGVLIL